MGYPKKKKNNINPYPTKNGKNRVEELMNKSDFKTNYLPKKIGIEDIDRDFIKMVKDGELKLIIDGKAVPVITLNNERWGEFSKTWKLMDGDKNLVPPFITIKIEDVVGGTYLDKKYTIPRKKRFTYVKEPTFKDGAYGWNIYKVPQPTAVDIKYEISLFTRYKTDVNAFIELVLERYSDGQLYINVNGHYINTMKEDGAQDNKENVDGEKYYVQKYNILAKGYIQNPDLFEQHEAFNRQLNVTEIADEEIDNNSIKRDKDNEDK